MRSSQILVALAAIALPAAARAQCPDAPAKGSVVINEIQTGPATKAFIELAGAPGTSIECLSIVATNGGQDGASCDTYATLALPPGSVIPEDGLFLVAAAAMEGADLVDGKADLQNGPDAVSLQHTVTKSLVDSVAYGSALDACETPVVEGGSPAPAPGNDQSIGRDAALDTDVNGKDFQLCKAPTPGAANDCPAPPPCVPEVPEGVALSELRMASGQEFVEIAGPVGLNLGCFTLVLLNGGSANDQCEPAETPLVGKAIDDAGFASITVDLQKGPDGVELVYRDDDGAETRIDSVAYKAKLTACPDIGQGGAAPVPPDEQSISKCGTAGDDAADWLPTPPTPSAKNACPEPCGPATGKVVVNEVVYDPDPSAFVELKGDPGLDLSCYTLVELNGGTGGVDCKDNKVFPLTGLAIPDDGYLVLSKAELEGADMTVSFGFQNGPDAFRLTYAGPDGVVVVDQVAWNGELAACTVAAPDAGAGPVAKEGASVARCPDGADTDVATADLAVAEATPGAANVCTGGGGGGGGAGCELPKEMPKLNEIQTTIGAQSFIEIYGAGGTDLSCFTIVAYNGGDGSTCDETASIPLTDAKIPKDGYLVVASGSGERADVADVKSTKADLQDGPDAVALVFAGAEGPLVVDSLVYGGELPACVALGVGEGKNAAKAAKATSLTRCKGADSNDNSADFTLCKTPSPGEATTCACAGAPAPPGSGGSVEEPGACSTSGQKAPLALLALLVMLLGLATLRRRA